MIICLVILFLIGYLMIALEHPIRVDKAATALLLGMLLWVCFAAFSGVLVPQVYPTGLAEFSETFGNADEPIHVQALHYLLEVLIVYHLGDIAQTLFFLIGAMTIVELVDAHQGFTVITNKITTKNKKLLLVVVCFVTFILSAVLDNLTTTIVMLMLLRKLIADQKERWIFAGMIVIAANTGGAWSPIGDVTTIMLWVKGNVTTPALITFVLLPSIVALLVPLFIVRHSLSGEVVAPQLSDSESHSFTTMGERKLIFWLGIGGLIFVPIFKSITHLPPFIGVLFVLGLLWVFTEVFYNRKKIEKTQEQRLSSILKRIDMSTILFFLGILMAVAALQSAGILSSAASWLNEHVGSVYVINIILGVLSSVVDNVPLVAAAMGMYPVDPASAEFMVDGVFWEFLSYCAGVGGSILIIGSAAGVIAMGIEKIEFGWYLKRFSLLALAGYLAGAAVYIAEALLLKGA